MSWEVGVKRRVIVAAAAISMSVLTTAPASAANAKPSPAACKAAKKVVKIAEEALYAMRGSYGTMSELVSEGMLRRPSRFYDVTLGTDGFTVTAKPKSGCR